MQKKIFVKLKLLASLAIFGLVVMVGLVGKPAQAITTPVYVQFRSTVSSALENVATVPVSFMFTDANLKNVSHGNIDIYYQITGSANLADYVFNNQPNVVVGVIHVPAGFGDYNVSLNQVNDHLLENAEFVVVQITAIYSKANLTIGPPLVRLGQNILFTHTIVDDDLPGNLNITNVWDGTTASRIYSPDLMGVQLGKWKFEAANSDLTLNKIKFQILNPSGGPLGMEIPGGLNTFGHLYLYDGNNLVAVGNYGPSDDVVFAGFISIIPDNNYKIYTLRGDINPSGIIMRNTPIAFVIKSDSHVDMEVSDEGGILLDPTDINYNLVSNDGPDESRFAMSTVYKYHDAYPDVVVQPLGATLSLNNNAKIFKFSVTNKGAVSLNFHELFFISDVSGMVGVSASISGFKIYEENSGGNLGVLIAQSATIVPATPYPSSYLIGFGSFNDFNNAFDNLVIAPGATRTFIITADTTNILDANNIGSITISSRIYGTAGWNSMGNYWNTGGLTYRYMPTGQTTWFGPFADSDSFPVFGDTLTYTSL